MGLTKNLSTGDLISMAAKTFSSTIGCSPNAVSTYTKKPELLDLALTPKNVGYVVTHENYQVRHGKGKSIQDRLALVFTPLRRPVAHAFAQGAITGVLGFYSNKSIYAREALVGLTSHF